MRGMTLRQQYSFIRFVEANGEGESVKDWLAQLKREVRAEVNRQSDRRYIGQYEFGDGFLEVIDVPVDTLEEAEEWFEAEEFRGYPAWLGGAISWGADCTGETFTIWHKIVRLGGKLVCYHRVGVDL